MRSGSTFTKWLAMEFDITDAVESSADASLIWRRMLEPSAVIGVLGGKAAGIRPYRFEDSPAEEGHTFTITGVGGGLYHARVDERTERSAISYTVWRDDAPDSSMILSFRIDGFGPRRTISGEVTMDMPIEELFASFSLASMLALPLVGRLMRRYMARRLRSQLRSFAASGDEHEAR